MCHGPHINESCLIVRKMLVQAHTHTPNTHNHTRPLSLSFFLFLSDSLSLSHTHTDIGEGVQESRHVTTADCHIQKSHDAGAASRIEAADCSIGGSAPTDCSVDSKSMITIMGFNIVIMIITHRVRGWRRCIGCLQLQIFIRKRATNFRALFQNMTCNDKTSYVSTPPCIIIITYRVIMMKIWCTCDHNTLRCLLLISAETLYTICRRRVMLA